MKFLICIEMLVYRNKDNRYMFKVMSERIRA